MLNKNDHKNYFLILTIIALVTKIAEISTHN